jgi:hypothetical protein
VTPIVQAFAKAPRGRRKVVTVADLHFHPMSILARPTAARTQRAVPGRRQPRKRPVAPPQGELTGYTPTLAMPWRPKSAGSPFENSDIRREPDLGGYRANEVRVE